jgi:hypothetical protein
VFNQKDFSPWVLNEVAQELACDSDVYVCNAGLTILGLPSVVEDCVLNWHYLKQCEYMDFCLRNIPRLTESELSFEKISIVPSPRLLTTLRGSEAYNFVRSVENLLRLEEMASACDKQELHNVISSTLGEILEPMHHRALEWAALDVDMEGTLVAKYYGK